MKRYEFVRIKCGSIMTAYLTKEDHKEPREVITEMASRGYAFRGTVPVYDFGGKVYEYDMVFETDEE